MRFTEVRRAIGDISPHMLAQALRALERDGYLSCEVFPPRVDYTLTALGDPLLTKVTPLIR